MDRISKHFKFAYARRNGVRKISKQNPHSLVDIFITKTLDYREYSGIFELHYDRIQRWYETRDSSVFIWFSWAHTTDNGTQTHVYTLSIFNFNFLFFHRKHRDFEQHFVCIKFTFCLNDFELCVDASVSLTWLLFSSQSVAIESFISINQFDVWTWFQHQISYVNTLFIWRVGGLADWLRVGYCWWTLHDPMHVHFVHIHTHICWIDISAMDFNGHKMRRTRYGTHEHRMHSHFF